MLLTLERDRITTAPRLAETAVRGLGGSAIDGIDAEQLEGLLDGVDLVPAVDADEQPLTPAEQERERGLSVLQEYREHRERVRELDRQAMLEQARTWPTRRREPLGFTEDDRGYGIVVSDKERARLGGALWELASRPL